MIVSLLNTYTLRLLSYHENLIPSFIAKEQPEITLSMPYCWQRYTQYMEKALPPCVHSSSQENLPEIGISSFCVNLKVLILDIYSQNVECA